MFRGGGAGAGFARQLAEDPLAALVVVLILVAIVWWWWRYQAAG